MDEDRFERYRRALVAEVVRFGRGEQDAHDVVQEVMIATLKHADRVPPGAEWAYLKTAAFRRAINQATRPRSDAPPGYGREAEEPPSAEAMLIAEEERRRFRHEFKRVFDSFPPLTQQIFILRSRGLGFDDVAKKLGITSTNARTRFSRSAQILREELGTPPDGAELPGDDHEQK
jgi:RNA polymerase sigma factor (sigma-70 family)